VILPEDEAAQRLTQRLMLPSLHNYFELIEGYSVAELEVPEAFHGRTLMELDLRRKFGVNLVALKRKVGERHTVDPVPAPTEIIQAGDVIAVAGADASLAKLLDLARQV
jgi:trk system potassium uptake protein TrkA